MNLNENVHHLHPEKQNAMYHFTNHPMYHQNTYTQPCTMFIDHAKHSITAHNTHVITHNTQAIAHHTQVTNHHTQGTAHNTPTTAHYTQATAHSPQTAAQSIQTAIRHTQAIAHNTQTTAHHIQSTAHNTQSIAHNTQPTAHNTQPIAHNTQPTAHSPQPNTHNTQPSAHNIQAITHNTQSSAHNNQPTAHNTQPTAHNLQTTTNDTQNTVHTTQSTANNIQTTAHNTQLEAAHEKETPVESQVDTVTATHKIKAEVKAESEAHSTKSEKKIKIVGKTKNSVDTSHFTIEERLIAAVWVHERKNIKKSMRQLNHDFHQRFGRKPPAKNTLLGWERKLFTTGCLEDAPRTGRPVKRRNHVEEVAASVRAAPALSLRARALALRVPTTTLHTILRRDLAQPAAANTARTTPGKTPTKKSPKKTKPAKRKPNEQVQQMAQTVSAPLATPDACSMFTDSVSCHCTKCELLTI